MVSQASVDAHAKRIESLVSSFARHVEQEVVAVSEALTAYLLGSLRVKNGVIRQVPENAAAILGIEALFHTELNRSGFYACVMALVSSFIDQADEFRAMYEQMGDGLPEMFLDDEDREVLGNQVAAALAAIEGQVMKVNLDLRQLLTRSLGEVKVSDLVQGVNSVVTRLNRVEPIAKDQLILFFRMIGNLVYRSVDPDGENSLYFYVGPEDEGNRDFCSKLSGSGAHSRSSIEKMDNGQVPNVFDTCGGYGCRHWWAIQL